MTAGSGMTRLFMLALEEINFYVFTYIHVIIAASGKVFG
jgi:hypothetical protein